MRPQYFAGSLFSPVRRGSRAGAGGYHSLQDLRPNAGKPARAPPLRARVCAPRLLLLRLLRLCGTAARSASLSSPRAPAWAPAASMDARRVRVSARLLNPRGGCGGCWARANSFQLRGRSAAYPPVAVLGGALVGKPQILCISPNSEPGADPAGRAHPARWRSEIFEQFSGGLALPGARSHVRLKCTCPPGRTAAGARWSPIVSPGWRGAPPALLPRGFALQPCSPFQRAACERVRGSLRQHLAHWGGPLDALPAGFCACHTSIRFLTAEDRWV